MDSTRVDRWLWAVRLFKTRSAAADACRGGHVRINGRAAKPSSAVRMGDRVEARVNRRERVAEVGRLIDKRVGAAIASQCYIDHSPPPPEVPEIPIARRDRGAGRPTKRERRQLERWRQRNR
ncbi:MAG: RNA-binding S4 domain-containing protein [Actinobacteria bacterium]|nr:RNA-binding S4 domain-containing protein [Actinomycetota bacterium]